MGTWSKGGALTEILAKTSTGPAQTAKVRPPVNSIQETHAPKNWQERNAEQFNASQQAHELIGSMGRFDVDPDPEYDWAAKAEQLASQIAKLKTRAGVVRQNNTQVKIIPGKTITKTVALGPGQSLPTPTTSNGVPKLGKGDFASFVRAISGQESGGNYGAVNSDSGALGKYQIMPSNFSGSGGWDMAALGREITTQQFLGSPSLQEKIAQYKLREYFNKYGARGAASAWYSGDPNKYKNNSPQGGYPSIAAYVDSIIRKMGGG
jgi:hypothetical protein